MKHRLQDCSKLLLLLLIYCNPYCVQAQGLAAQIGPEKDRSLVKESQIKSQIVPGNLAEEREISGKVTGFEGEALPGVNILVKNTDLGTVTDVNGNYAISVPDEASILIFSSIGYETIEIDINGRSVIDVQMEVDVETLEEIVVVGYGTVKKSDLTGSVASIKEEQIIAFPTLGAVQALQGRASGVQIQSNNGEPGSDFKVRIRGGTSINASSDPIFVVDGFVGATLPPAEDIASVEVLKDASATAIYGSRGANGVVMVTTKRGQSGKTKINFNASYSSQEEINRLDLLNAEQFTAYRQEIDPNFVSAGSNTDWQEEIFRTGAIQNYQLSLSGGSENVNYYLSGTYFDQKGLIIGSNYDRFSLTSNIDIKATEKLKVGLNIFARRIQRDGSRTQETSGGANGSGVVASAFKFEPDQPVFNPDGTFTLARINDPHDNPVAIATQRQEERVDDRLQANVFAEYDLLKNLKFRTTFGASTNNRRFGTFIPTTLNAGRNVGGEASVEGRKTTLFLNENYLTYTKSIMDGHDLTIMGGYSYQKSRSEQWEGTGQSFITDAVEFWGLDGSSNFQSPDSELEEWELSSWYGRVNYNIGGKYLFTFNARYDGSSSFSKNEKWSFFPSGAFAWNIGDEAFMQNFDWLSQFKIRTSYGLTGNQAIDPFQTLARFANVFTVIDGSIVNAVRPSRSANNDLVWETTAQFDVGLDIGLLGDRLSLTLDYYNMRTSDLLFGFELPEYSGGDLTQLKNIGEVENKGFEFSITSRNLVGDLTWTTDLNFSANRNKVIKLPDGNDIRYASGPGHMVGLGDTQILREGQPVGSFLGWIYEGVYQEGDEFIAGGAFEQEAGGERYLDFDNSGQLDNDDRTIIGDPNPDFIWGLNNDFQWKGFDLNIFIQGSQGNDILSYTLLELDLLAGQNNATTQALNRWTPTNTDTNVPKAATRSRRVSTRWIFDGSYIRFKNIGLGYTFPKALLDKLKIEKLRLYVSAQNIITITDYEGYDPEVNYRTTDTNPSQNNSNRNLGLDYGSYPNARAVTVGVNVGF